MDFKDKTIANVSDYLRWVKKTFLVDNGGLSFKQNKVYYRGQGDASWGLTPGVLRELDNGKKLNESRLLKVAELRLWNELHDCRSYLEKLIYLQHYGLKTRLLDVTFNPLIALYMACSDEKSKDKDGAVYCGHQVEHSDSIAIEKSAEYLFTTGQPSMTFLDLKDFINRWALEILTFTKPQFVLPPINNPRMEAQNGAFIIPPLIKDEGCTPYDGNLINSDLFDNKRAIIKAEYKEGILKELSQLGVNIGTIYKGIPEKLQAIIQEEIWNLDEMTVTD